MNNNTNTEFKQFETIEKYLDNSMDTEDREKFERLLQENQEFKNDFEETKALILGIEVNALKNQLNTFHSEMEGSKNKDVIKNKKLQGRSFAVRFLPYAAAASVLLILGLFLYNNEMPSNQELFAKHFTPDPGLPTKMGSSENFEFYDGMVDYKRAEYGAAIEKWSRLQIKDSKNDTLNYFLGVAYLAQGNEIEAQKYLQNAAQYSKGFLENETYYYLALAYLKANKPIEARQNLKKTTIKDSKTILDEIAE